MELITYVCKYCTTLVCREPVHVQTLSLNSFHQSWYPAQESAELHSSQVW